MLKREQSGLPSLSHDQTLNLGVPLRADDIEAIYRGASIFATGGGFPLAEQRRWFSPTSECGIVLKSLEQLRPRDYVCGVFTLGSAARDTYSLRSCLAQAVQTLQQLSGHSFCGIFPVESGIESSAFQAATELQVSVVDADSTGGRAVPTMLCDNCWLVGRTPLPLVAVTPEGRTLVIEGAVSAQEIEDRLASFAADSESGLVACADHSISAEEAIGVLSLGTLSRSLQVGKLMMQSPRPTDMLIHSLNAQDFGEMRVLSREVWPAESSRFLEGVSFLQGQSGQTYQIYFRNENISLSLGERIVKSAPDLISLCDPATFVGLHNRDIHVGMVVRVLGIPCSRLWSAHSTSALFL
ncbi:MAG: DUF917 domain-containing protein [Oligoflexia bacterium]|nr:DUF917 domain-containing protein [Oligoflexia bacterium]